MTNMPFMQLITEHRNGDTEKAVSEKLRELIDGLRAYGGKGKLTLDLAFQLTEYGMLEVKAEVKAKIPEEKLKPSAFYITADGLLSRRDPNQTDIEDMEGVRRQPRPSSPVRLAAAE